jgi:hypothetical protein
MPSAERKPVEDQYRYTMSALHRIRRAFLQRARSVPPGPARNQHRQLATSIRRLFRDKEWLAAHTMDRLE